MSSRPSLIRTGLASLAGVVALSLAGCGPSGSESAAASGSPVVQATNYPLTYFATRIGGDAVDVQFRAPGDGDPAFWEPRDADIAAMQAADLVLTNGATYEKWMKGVSLPASRIVDTSAGFASRTIEVAEESTHSHGEGEQDHSHGGTAFTTWIDFQLAGEQVEAVRDALVGLVDDADVKAAMRTRTSELLAEIAALDAELAQVTSLIGDAPLTASHPVYQYFARRYALDVSPLMWEPETVPDDAAMADLAAIRAAKPAAWMIWEGEPDPASVARLEAVGVASVIFDPCGNRPDSGDWMSEMKSNIQNLRRIGGGA